MFLLSVKHELAPGRMWFGKTSLLILTDIPAPVYPYYGSDCRVLNPP